MSLLYTLPDDLCHCFLSDWLEVVDLGLLDEAVTNHRLRTQHLVCLECTTCSLPPKSQERSNLSTYYKWTYIRKLKLLEVELNDILFDDLRLHTDIVRYQSVQRLHAMHAPFSDITKVLLECHSLTELSCRINAFDGEAGHIIRQLESLEIIDEVDVDFGFEECTDPTGTFELVAQCCSSLKSFVYDLLWDLQAESLMNVLKSNPGLQTISIWCDTSVLQCIIDCSFRDLKDFRIAGDVEGNIGGAEVAAVLHQYNSTLTTFEFQTPSLHFNYAMGYLIWSVNENVAADWFLPILALKIENLSLYTCCRSEDPGMVTVFNHIKDTLNSLILVFTVDVNSSAVGALLRCCHSLRTVTVTLIAANWTLVFAEPSSFHELYLTGFYTPSDILQILKMNKRLEFLHVSSDDGVCLSDADQLVLQNAFSDYEAQQEGSSVQAQLCYQAENESRTWFYPNE